MDKDEALRIALEALVDFGWHIENCPQFPTWAEPKKHPPCTCGYDTAITALRQALEQPDPVEEAVLAEREACAKACESIRPSKQEYDQRFYTACTLCANAIRARGE